MQHGHGGILLDCWNEGAWSLRAARAELGMAMALELLLRYREMRRLGRERCREEGTEGEGRDGGSSAGLGRSSSPWSTWRARTSWIEGRPRVESGWWDWIRGNEGIPRKKGRWRRDGTRGLEFRV